MMIPSLKSKLRAVHRNRACLRAFVHNDLEPRPFVRIGFGIPRSRHNGLDQNPKHANSAH